MSDDPPPTLVVVADTHGTDDPRLVGRTAAAVDAAERVIHAGDLTTERVLDAFAARTELHAVHGNADDDGVRERLPATRTLVDDGGGVRVVVTHTHEGGPTALSVLGRAKGADLVAVGHTHRPSVVGENPTLLNPGSHADPRGGPATHAELRPTDGGLAGTIRSVDGEVVERFVVDGREG